ncbi:MAG TPA: phosphoribosylglycinamide formyltransferase [Silvibacterium sp.]|jgi:phosphoribosylglycinamide formyltransferase-1|nr:phosphoribosylglycinamide formyltransferase [Silvibacterium sp.]
MSRLGILLSGRGSNFLAIAENIAQGKLKGCEIAVVISNKVDAPGLEAARARGLKAVAIEARGRKRAEHDQEIVACLREHKVDLVCLAGYMRLLSSEFVQAFPERILNIHPSLLPAFPGLEAQEQAFAYGVQVAGCTVHFVDEQLDHGVIVLQKTVPVLEGDDAHALSARILEEEHIAYSEAIARVLSGQYRVVGRRYVKE